MMEDLSTKGLVGFTGFGSPLMPSGVYCLVLAGAVMYVGKSLNVYARVGQHVWTMKRNKKGLRPYKNKPELPPINFDEVQVKFVQAHLIDAEEIKLIQRYRPAHNVLENRPRIDVSDIPSVAKLCKASGSVRALAAINAGRVKRRAA